MTDISIKKGSRRNESDLRRDAIDPKNVSNELMFLDCKTGRGIASGCPNKFKCRNQFQGLGDIIINLRQLIFFGMKGHPCFDRHKNLFSVLLLGRRDESEGVTIGFTLAGKVVCKSFFRQCTGVRRQLFDSTFQEALDELYPTRKIMRPPKTYTVDRYVKLQVVAILDRIFCPKKTKKDPTGKYDAISIRSSWKDIFDKDFLTYTGGEALCTYRAFCHIRKQERPRYSKSPRMTKGISFFKGRYCNYCDFLFWIKLRRIQSYGMHCLRRVQVSIGINGQS